MIFTLILEQKNKLDLDLIYTDTEEFSYNMSHIFFFEANFDCHLN